MRKILLLLPLLVFHCLYAQQTKHDYVRCINMDDHEKELQAKDPTRKARRDAFLKYVQQWIENQSVNRVANVETQYTIPIVFHVVYHTPQEEISIQQIKTQVKVLNEDYNRLNPDASHTPGAFLPAAANFHITFCLAQQTPQGWPSTGVVYKQTSVVSFVESNDPVKRPSMGGDTIWNPKRYLNIWICPLAGGLLGYSEFPTANLDNTFGSVINYESVGDSGYLPLSQYNLGRTVTHEIGHLLNLHHPWADDGGACPGVDDGCADTPPEGNSKNDGFGDGGGPTFNSPTFPYTDNCSTVSPGIMFENFMEYTDDKVMNLFTNDQYTIALATLLGPLDSLISTSHACEPGGFNEITFDNSVSIYPNPSSSGLFNIHIGLTNFSHINAVVYTVLGQTIYAWSSDNSSKTMYDLNLSQQPNGLYFVRIYNDEFSVVKKIMIEK